MRYDLTRLQEWIKPGSRVLDLGCGDGALLEALARSRQVQGLGVEMDPDHINACLARGISVVEQDINAGLGNFETKSFDTVVMTLAIQALERPHDALDEMLRIGDEAIVTFPNFGHWRCRWQLGLLGRMPVSRYLPYQWYDTPNIHFCTVRDFETLCREKGLRILNRAFVGAHREVSAIAQRWPNLFGVTAIYHIAR
ncbi:MAG: methionine biosynthesis protein MetW [Spongiibacteraceae bacterium]|jgi:methionine biosynthesis protein MetW|nr:methionine biosynthesis protein MetW [Spongiibacteraceae bacterium]